MITVKEIAKHCDVSPSTVSNILNGKSNVGEATKHKVLAYVKKTGYQPNYFAQNIRNKGSRLISIIAEDLTVFGTNPVVESIMAYCDDNNYRTVLMNLGLYKKWRDTWYNDVDILKASASPAIAESLAIRVKGIIYVAGHCRMIDCFPDDYSTPSIIAYGLSQNNKFPSVVIDDEGGGYDITNYLITKNHRKIGLIAGAEENLHTKSRLHGYQKALFDNGLLYNPSVVYYGNWRRASGYAGAKQLLSEGVTAMFCMNDEMAAGAYDFLYDSNISVGKDISIAGFDNMELSDYLRPRLTTNEVPLVEIGKKAAEILIQTLEGTSADMHEHSIFRMPCNIVERESVHDVKEKA